MGLLKARTDLVTTLFEGATRRLGVGDCGCVRIAFTTPRAGSEHGPGQFGDGQFHAF